MLAESAFAPEGRGYGGIFKVIAESSSHSVHLDIVLHNPAEAPVRTNARRRTR